MPKHRRLSSTILLGVTAILVGAILLPEGSPVAALEIPPPEDLCSQTTAPDRTEGTALSTITAAGLQGVTYDTTSGALQLARVGGAMQTRNITLDDVFMACAGDFDEDGWSDFVASDYAGGDNPTGVGFLKLYRNDTATSAVPDWSNPSATRDPVFTVSSVIEAGNAAKGAGTMLCADIDEDGHMDFLVLRCSFGSTCSSPARADAFLGNGDGTFEAPYQFLNTLDIGGMLILDGARMVLHDVNGDGEKDLIVGAKAPLLPTGIITAYGNDGANPPMFASQVLQVTVAGVTSVGVSALAIADFTNDGRPDVIYGSLDSLLLTLIPGTDSGFAGLPQLIPFAGFAINLVAGDFTRTGRADLIAVTDGLAAYLYANDGDSNPFSGGATATMTPGGPASSTFDAAFVMDYDHDPQGTLDLVAANGDIDNEAFVFANRLSNTFVDCGVATSSVLPTPEVSSADGTIVAVRISPEPAAPDDGTWSFEASNDDGVTWNPAPPCADDATDYCADLTSTTGTQLRWRVTMCSNTSGPTPNTEAPEITAVETRYTFVLATTHFRAGPVMRDDIIYVGATREPGREGRFLAIDNSTGTVLWDAAALLDSTPKDQRHIFTNSAAGLRLDMFVLSLLDMLDVLNVLDLLQGNGLVDWLTSPRFGVTTPRVMGGVLNSTAAVLSRPGRPYFFALDATPESEKDLINTHVETFQDRQNLVFVGSQTGMLHAFYTNPLEPANANNGKEAWAWVPRNVSRRMLGDKTSGAITAYVDGSPTLADVKIGSAYRTVLVMGEGKGGDEVYALDVTETIDPTSGAVLGPQFLWRFNDSNMGETISKPTIIRTFYAGNEHWLAVFASGPDPTGDKGDTLYAVNIEDGALVWRFDIGDSDTYISTDITAADEEVGEPDGFISRLYFGDNKGRVWKLDPTLFSGSTATPLSAPVNVGLGKNALFSTRLTDQGLGEDRAISANIIAVPDLTDRLVLYFGTGGTAETAPGETNAFYAVLADTGEIRNKVEITGSRFFGASFQDGQIVFARSTIPDTAGPCVVSTSRVVAIDANTFAEQFFQEFEGLIGSPVYMTGGELFAVTVTGKLITSQYTGNNVATPPSGPSGPSGPGNQPGKIDSDVPFRILGWRQTY